MEEDVITQMCIGSALKEPGLYLVSSQGTRDNNFDKVARVIGKAPFFKFKIVDTITFQPVTSLEAIDAITKCYFKPIIV